MIKNHSLAAVMAIAITATSAASAQSSIQIYGLLDTAVEHLSNTNAAGDGLTRMPSIGGGMFPPRIGFRGTEDLGGGLKAIFTLESGFTSDAGTMGQGNRLFGRQAWVGLSGDFGAVTVGRTYSMLTYSFFDVDNIGPAQFGIGNFDPYLPNARHDNSIAYKGTFKGVTIGGTYSLGRDASNAGGPAATNCGGEVATDSKACRNWSAMLRYDTPKWGVVAAYDTFNGGAGASAAFSPTRSDQSDSRMNVGAWGKVGALKFGGGLVRRENEGNLLTPKSDLVYLDASYFVTTALLLEGQISRIDVKNSANDGKMYLLRAVYSLSPRTAVYAMVGRVENKGSAAFPLSAGATVAIGGSQNGVITGIKHSF